MSTIHNYLKSLLIMTFLTAIVAIDVYGQYGTSRRVARRTARRTASRQSIRQDAYPGGTITTLPGGCVFRSIGGINYQYCNGIYYRPYYQGAQVVYVIENP